MKLILNIVIGFFALLWFIREDAKIHGCNNWKDPWFLGCCLCAVVMPYVMIGVICGIHIGEWWASRRSDD